MRDAGLPRRAREGVRPASSRRQHDGRAGQQRRTDEVEPGAEHPVPRAELHERRRLLERRGEAGRRVHDAPRRARRARGEQDERGGVVRAAGDGRRRRRDDRGEAVHRCPATRDVAQRAGASVARSGSRTPRRAATDRRTRDPASVATPPSVTTARTPAARHWAASSAGARPGSSTTTTMPARSAPSSQPMPSASWRTPKATGSPASSPARGNAPAYARTRARKCRSIQHDAPARHRGSPARRDRTGAATRSSSVLERHHPARTTSEP